MSILTAYTEIPERAEATPSLFNTILSTLSANIRTASEGPFTSASTDTLSFTTNLLVSGGGKFQFLSVGSTPPSEVTTAAVTIAVNSASSDYLYLTDSSGARSNYVIGSRAGGTADGLNIWDASGDTMIASFSKQSVRFFQNVVGPVFDTGGALADTYNAATFVGSGSTLSGIQAAINQASIDGISHVYLPASMYPYSASSISFISTVKMVREGGNWADYDVRAYGAAGDGIANDTAAIQATLDNAIVAGGEVRISQGTYIVTSTLTIIDVRPNVRNHFRIVGAGSPDAMLDGNPDWTDRGGAIIKYTTANGSHAVSFAPSGLTSSAALLSLENIQLIGPGAGSGNGINLVGDLTNSRVIRIDFRTVAVDSFASGIGCHLFFVENSSTRNFSCSRNSCGLLLEGATNANSWYNFVAQYNTEAAVIIRGCVTNHFFGGLIQNNYKNGIDLVGVDQVSFHGIHFENNNSVGSVGKHAAIIASQPSADSTNHQITFDTCRFVTNGDTVVLTADSAAFPTTNVHFRNCRSLAASSLSIGTNVSGTLLEGALGGTITDNGTNTVYLTSIAGIPSGSALAPGYAFSSEQSLGFYRSAASTMAMSYGTLAASMVSGPVTTASLTVGPTANPGISAHIDVGGSAARIIGTGSVGHLTFGSGAQSPTNTWLRMGWDAASSRFVFNNFESGANFGVITTSGILGWTAPIQGIDATALEPMFRFSSESSLGWYRSGVSSLGLSYGTLNLNQARLVSIRTADPANAITNAAANEIYVGVGVSNATLWFKSGNTVFQWATSSTTTL